MKCVGLDVQSNVLCLFLRVWLWGRDVTWEKGSREFTCDGCATKWRANYVSLPVREKGEFECKDCGVQVVRWNGGVDYSGFQRVPKGGGD